MTSIVYIIVFFSLMLLQTTILPAFFNFFILYDFLLILVIYIGFYSSIAEGLPTVIVMGMVADCLSGGAFGIFTTTYIWLYAVVTIVIRYLHAASQFLIIIAIVSGVLWENLIVIMTFSMDPSATAFSFGDTKTVLAQLLLVILTGPPIFFMIKGFHSFCETLLNRFKESRKDKNDFKRFN